MYLYMAQNVSFSPIISNLVMNYPKSLTIFKHRLRFATKLKLNGSIFFQKCQIYRGFFHHIKFVAIYMSEKMKFSVKTCFLLSTSNEKV